MFISISLPLPDFNNLLPLEAFACKLEFPSLKPGDFCLQYFLDGYLIRQLPSDENK